MNHRSRSDLPTNDPLNFGLGGVKYIFCVDYALRLELTKGKRLAAGATSASTSSSVDAEARLVHFKSTVQRRGLFTGLCKTLSNLEVDRIHLPKRDSHHFSSHGCYQIDRKTTHQLAKFIHADFREVVVPLFSNHLTRLS